MKSAIDELIREAFSALQHDSSPDEEAHRHLENVLRKQFSATLKKHKADRIAELERQNAELRKDAEIGKLLMKHGEWLRFDLDNPDRKSTFLALRLAPDADLSCSATRYDAIAAAPQAAQAKGGEDA